jgi:hypothetical protein
MGGCLRGVATRQLSGHRSWLRMLSRARAWSTAKAVVFGGPRAAEVFDDAAAQAVRHPASTTGLRDLYQFSASPALPPVLSDGPISTAMHPLTHRFLNIRLDGIRVQDAERFPHMVSRAHWRNAEPLLHPAALFQRR